MLGKTHLAGGLAAFTALAITTGPLTKEEAAVEFVCCMLGSVLPDIDHKQSKISRSDIVVGAASEIICTFTKHRGITHTPIGCVLLALIGYFTARAAVPYANANAAFMAAIIIFTLVHCDTRKKKLNKFGGILAISTFFYYPHIAEAVTGLPNIAINSGYEVMVGISILVGALSHLLLDMLNPEGCMLLYPCKKRIHLARIRTGTKSEIVVTALCVLASAFVLWTMKYQTFTFITQ